VTTAARKTLIAQACPLRLGALDFDFEFWLESIVPRAKRSSPVLAHRCHMQAEA